MKRSISDTSLLLRTTLTQQPIRCIQGSQLRSRNLALRLKLHSVHFAYKFASVLQAQLWSQGAEILKECSPPQTCPMSRVTCHLSHVTCHMSHVKVVKLIGGGYIINGPTPSSFFLLTRTPPARHNQALVVSLI